MNAVIREKYEARVLTNDTIEVHLTYLRSGLDAVQAALPALRDKLVASDAALGTKIDKAVEKLEARDTALGGKMDKLAETVLQISTGLAEIRGLVRTTALALTLAGVVASVVSIARTFDWI